MEVIGVSSVPVIKVIFVISRMYRESGELVLEQRVGEDGKRFSLSVPRRFESSFLVGDTVVALCIPNNDLTRSNDTLFLSKRQSGSSSGGHMTTRLFAKNSFWTEQYEKLGQCA